MLVALCHQATKALLHDALTPLCRPCCSPGTASPASTTRTAASSTRLCGASVVRLAYAAPDTEVGEVGGRPAEERRTSDGVMLCPR
jgi:hypothetical protein